MKYTHRIFALVLILALFAALAGCAGGSGTGTSAAPQSAAGGTTAAPALPDYDPNLLVFQPSYTSLPGGLEYMNEAIFRDGHFWGITSVQTEEKDDRGYPVWKSVLVGFRPDGSDFVQLELPELETEDMNGYWAQLVPISDGFAGTAALTDKKDERGMAQTYVFYHLDAEGKVLKEADISKIAEGREWFGFMGALADAEDRVYFFTDGGILVYSPDGESLFTLDSSWINASALTGEGKPLAAYYNGQGGYEIAEIDAEKRDFGKKYPMPTGNSNIRNLMDGDEQYLFFAQVDDTVYGYDAASESYEKLFRFLDMDISGDSVNSLYNIGDRTFVSFLYDDTAGGQQLCAIREAPQGQPKITLTLASFYTDYTLKNAVVAFNRSNPTYRIDIQDYSQYSTEEDYQAGLARLNTDLLSGSYPDLIDLTQLPRNTYAAKGLLCDIGAMLDEDPDLSRDDFLPSALKALEIGGKLYSIAATMNPMCLMSTKDILGDRTSLTAQDAAALLKAHPGASFIPDGTADNVLMMLCMFSMDDFIDQATGQCRFNSPEFQSLLEIAAQSPTEIDYSNQEYVPEEERLRNGETLFSTENFFEVTEYQRFKAALGDNLAVTGFPTSSGTGFAASFQPQLGIISKSAHIDGAWTFIKYLFSPVEIPEKPDDLDDETWAKEVERVSHLTNIYLRSLDLPIWRDAFEYKLRDAATQEYYDTVDGEHVMQPKLSMVINDGPRIEIYAATEEDIAEFRAIVDAVDRSYSYDEQLIGIIQEEAGAYFAGQKSAADVAAIIQSRVSTYIAESR